MLPPFSTDFTAAEAEFRKILAIDPYRVDDIDILSNILYVTENNTALSKLAHDYLAVEKDRPEICCIIGKLLGTMSTSIAKFAYRRSRELLFITCRTRKSGQILQTRDAVRSNVSVRLDSDGT